MPSAQHVEIVEPSGRPAAGDLQSLLREIHGSNGRNNGRNLESLHGRGKVLFTEGEPARGVYILCSGRASVSVGSPEGRVVTLRMAQPGDVLGLNPVLRNTTYDTTVKTLEPCRTSFIPRAELIVLLEGSTAGANALLRLMSDELSQMTERSRSLLLPQTAGARLARLLLDCSKESLRIDRVFTHEEIAQMICSSRETVTRLLATLSRGGIIQITSDSILICDRPALESMTK